MYNDSGFKKAMKVLEEVAKKYPQDGPAAFEAMREGLRREWDEEGAAKENQVHASTKESTWRKPGP